MEYNFALVHGFVQVSPTIGFLYEFNGREHKEPDSRIYVHIECIGCAARNVAPKRVACRVLTIYSSEALCIMMDLS